MTNKMLFFFASTICNTSLVDAMVPTNFYYQQVQRPYIDQMGTLNVQQHVIEIFDKEFAGNQVLHNINIPGNIKRIGAFSFYQCCNVTSINLSNGVREISDYAFAGLYQVRDLIIPPSVTRIGKNALYQLNLRSFYILNPYCIIEPQDQFTAEQTNLPNVKETYPSIPHQNIPVMHMQQILMQHNTNTMQAHQPTVQMQNPAVKTHDTSLVEIQQQSTQTYDADDSIQSSIYDVQTHPHRIEDLLQLARNSRNTFKPIPVNVDGMIGAFDGNALVLEGKCIKIKNGCESFTSKLLTSAICQKGLSHRDFIRHNVSGMISQLNSRLTRLNCKVILNDGVLYLTRRPVYIPTDCKIRNTKNYILKDVPEFQFNHKYKIGEHELMINDKLQLCINSDININLIGRRSPYKRLIVLAKLICTYPAWIQFLDRNQADKHKQTFTDQYFNGTSIFIENSMSCIRLNSYN